MSSEIDWETHSGHNGIMSDRLENRFSIALNDGEFIVQIGVKKLG
jgi:hypothetical protein